jgi:hypothetical protein
MTAKPRRKASASSFRLAEPGWAPEVRTQLERLLRRGAGKGWPVVFDFDNTIVCGDIGEATLAVLARTLPDHPGFRSASVSPSFLSPGGALVTPATVVDPTEYYERFLTPTVHGADDPTPLANGYVWAVEAMAGLRVAEVVDATRAAFGMAEPLQRRMIEVTPGKTAYPAPFFYPEMVEFIARLCEARFDVWVVSASNVWSVRWMVLHGLNPLLRARGVRRGVLADHVTGVSALLTDREHRLYKDRVLVRNNQEYARLEPGALGDLTLTGKLDFPVPTYSGKVACIWDLLGRPPCLCAGDSPGDHAMLSFAEHRLWIARLEKPGYLRSTLALTKRCGPQAWLFQPTLTQGRPGFVPDAGTVRQRDPEPSASIRESLRLLGRRIR